ncbi:MAG: hypothetical protein ACI8XG_000982 [Congregibacter sp.]|jgi:hypothetical protein
MMTKLSLILPQHPCHFLQVGVRYARHKKADLGDRQHLDWPGNKVSSPSLTGASLTT